MRKTIISISSLLAIVFGGALIVHAEAGGALDASTGQYVPLAKLPIGPNASELAVYTMSTYLSGIIKLVIALGAGLAVLMGILAGVQYIAKGISPSAKNEAKEKMISALTGLALVLTSYLILNSINPDLVNFKLDLPPIGLSPLNTDYLNASTTPGGVSGSSWPSDSYERGLLTAALGGNAVVYINNPNCTTNDPHPSGCTSVYQLPDNAIKGIRALATACNCTVKVSGGTENGHTTHGPGISTVDMGHNSALDNYIKKNSSGPTTGGGCGYRTDAHYALSGPGGGTYVAEDAPNYSGRSNLPHWHVCLN